MSKWDNVEYFVYMDIDLFFFLDLVCIFVENLIVFLYLIDYCNLLWFMFYYEWIGCYNIGFVGVGNMKEVYEVVWQWRQECIVFCMVEMDME